MEAAEPAAKRSRPVSGCLDLISLLPDAILGEIISLLPTKDGARTQVLSRRWRPLWLSAPFNLEVCELSRSERKCIAFASRILAEHPGPARRFSLGCVRLRDRYAKVDGWLRSRALTDLQEFVLASRFEIKLEEQPPCPLPPSALRFAPTLRVLILGRCHFPNRMAAPPALNLPRLTRLTLHSVTISEEALHGVLSGCPALESLLLEGNLGARRLRICSQTLRSFGFSNCNWGVDSAALLQEVVIEDAPCLERLLPLYPHRGPASIRVISAPKLEALELLSDGISELHLGTTVFQKMTAVNLTTSMRSVKVLVLDSGPDLGAVDFLKCFPCLERLYIVSHPYKVIKNTLRYDPLHPIECVELHLEKVVVRNYGGKRQDVDFAKFFVLNAKVLREMEFGSPCNRNQKWLANQHRRLQLEKKAFQDAEFTFKTTFRSDFTMNRHTHDLSMSDPFDRYF